MCCVEVGVLGGCLARDILAVSWRWEWVGGLVFPALGALYLVAFWGRFHWSTYAVLSGSLFLLGGLFLLNWKHRAELRPPA